MDDTTHSLDGGMWKFRFVCSTAVIRERDRRPNDNGIVCRPYGAGRAPAKTQHFAKQVSSYSIIIKDLRITRRTSYICSICDHGLD